MPPHLFTPEYYRSLAAIEARHPWARAMRRTGRRLLERFAGREPRLLDVGCGTGGFLLETGDETAVGGDLAPQALTIARGRGFSRLALFSADAMPFRNAAFDAVVANDVLQHLRAPERFAAEAARVLRPDGTLIVRTAARRGLPGRRHRDTPDYRQWSPGILSALLDAAGFDVRFCRRVNYLPSLLADLRAAASPPPQGDTGLELAADEPPWKASLLGAYWALERFWLLRLGLPSPGGHTLFAAAIRRRSAPGC